MYIHATNNIHEFIHSDQVFLYDQHNNDNLIMVLLKAIPLELLHILDHKSISVNPSFVCWYSRYAKVESDLPVLFNRIHGTEPGSKISHRIVEVITVSCIMTSAVAWRSCLSMNR